MQRQQRAEKAIASGSLFFYALAVSKLTKQEQLVVCVILGLVLTGLAVKSYRLSHPKPQPVLEKTP